MNESALSVRQRATPWHLWAVGVLALLWNAIGAFDYLMTETRNASYMSHFPQAQLDFFYNMPAWVVGAWAVAVWGGVVGAVLLLMRKRLAVHVFLASMVGVLLTTIHNWVLSNASEVFPETGTRLFTGIILVIAVALYVYARAMDKRGLLS